MALPPEHRTARIDSLQAIVASTPRDKLMDFPALQPVDHQLIGIFIQLFNYMDFNLRRAIETFAQARLLQGRAAGKHMTQQRHSEPPGWWWLFSFIVNPRIRPAIVGNAR
jgi:hypothetical protein